MHDNDLGGVMISVLDLGAVDYGFEPRSRQIKDYIIGICCFSAKHAALKRKSKSVWLGIRTCNWSVNILYILLNVALAITKATHAHSIHSKLKSISQILKIRSNSNPK
jgi:hypothetical protein